jgi:hypothetical protein
MTLWLRYRLYIVPLGACVLLYLFAQLPQELFQNSGLSKTCLHAILFEKPCPGCGMTRALFHALHLQFGRSIHDHPCIIVLIPTLIIELIAFLIPTAMLKKTSNIFRGALCASIVIRYLTLLFCYK